MLKKWYIYDFRVSIDRIRRGHSFILVIVSAMMPEEEGQVKVKNEWACGMRYAASNAVPFE